MSFFYNKVVWVTGASSGIGEALVHELVAKGAYVILSARRESELVRVRDEAPQLHIPESTSAKNLTDTNGDIKNSSKSAKNHGSGETRIPTDSKQPHAAENTYILPFDLANHVIFEEVVAKAILWRGHVDILINNGGLSQRAFAHETSLEVEKRIFDVNYFGTIELTRHLIPHMIKRKSGHISVVSSVLGKMSVPLASTYCSSKHALHGYFNAVRAEVHQHNVKISIVCPGYIKTAVSINALKADGSNHAILDQNQAKGMDARKFSRIMLRKIASGREEFSIGGIELSAIYLKRLFPWLVSRVIRRLVPKAVKRR
jgi:short-subunit dehydrogenase